MGLFQNSRNNFNNNNIMDRNLIGKFLVRRGTTHDGKPVIILCGSFMPKDFKAEDIDAGDEMWVANITIHDGARFRKVRDGVDVGSPEEFLEGRNQRPEDWQSKENL